MLKNPIMAVGFVCGIAVSAIAVHAVGLDCIGPSLEGAELTIESVTVDGSGIGVGDYDSGRYFITADYPDGDGAPTVDFIAEDFHTELGEEVQLRESFVSE